MKVDGPVRVRMAPSPTGFLHIGGARTALFNYLFAKHYDGKFILRIEDTDKERSKKEYEEDILTDLKWLGLDWDEGPIKNGPFEPYYQSQRNEIYDKYKKILIDKGCVYECFCTPEDLEQERKELLKRGMTPRYRGKCRDLTDDVKSKLRSDGRKPVLRYRVDETDMIEVKDLVRGTVHVDPGIIGDFVVLKADGGPVYNFASVIDDHEMKISHVIRGEEHISNTPRQIILAKALGFEPPLYAHVSIILAPDRTKLSKRHGATSLGEYMKMGFLAEALRNYLALLGWNPGDEREVMEPEEIAKSFVIERMVKSPGIFDVQKLKWMNGVYIRNKPIGEIVKLLIPFMEEAGLSVKDKDPKWVEKVVNTVRGNLQTLSEIGQFADLFFDEKFNPDEKATSQLLKSKEESVAVLQALDDHLSKVDTLDEAQFQKIQKELKQKLSVKPKILFQTQRLGITGRLNGPEMVLVFPILGVKSTRERIQKTLALLK